MEKSKKYIRLMKLCVREKKQTIGGKIKTILNILIKENVGQWLKRILNSYIVYFFQSHLFQSLIV